MKKVFTAPSTLPGEFFDRFTILIKKTAVDSKNHSDLVLNYVKILKDNNLNGDLLQLICELQTANLDIWYLESEIRRGKEGELGLKEVGKRALAIREFNAIRVSKIDKINALFGVVNTERKVDHVSESNTDTL